ncbi:hypothetical protein BASA62_002814 [Batrachochytrium salamandrivorans]|nr:hypothetical protein BASA62_002814 [Batrachochytrium salamandrivorans]
MRVDIGIILSVLSFSALAKVIPNGGYNSPLLVRREVGPDTTDLLWKRADGDDEQGSSPMDLDIGAEAEAGAETSNNAEAGASASSDDSSSNQPSGSGRNTFCESDEESIKTVIEKVTEAFEGENKDEFISDIKTVLTIVLNSIRVFLAAYDSKDTAPFVLMIPGGTTDQQSSIEKILNMKKDGMRPAFAMFLFHNSTADLPHPAHHDGSQLLPYDDFDYMPESNFDEDDIISVDPPDVNVVDAPVVRLKHGRPSSDIWDMVHKRYQLSPPQVCHMQALQSAHQPP